MMKTANVKTGVLNTFLSNRVAMLLIAASVFFLYINTVAHSFTQDDAIVIYQNKFVKEGLSGLGDIFSNDTFRGFFQNDNDLKMLSGGRYRPLTLALFALLWDLFGDNPMVFHGVAIAFYALMSIILYKVLLLIGTPILGERAPVFSFLATLLFVFHPIHTEVVANVKGLDETAALLFGLSALYTAVLWVRRQKIVWMILSGCCITLGLLSKESIAPFIILVPGILFSFEKNRKIKSIFQLFGLYMITFIAYLALRISILGDLVSSAPVEMLNNPFIKVVDGAYIPFSFYEKWASIIWSLGKYFQLVFMPYVLTHDYYPRHVEVLTFSDPSVIMALVMNVCLVLIAVIGLRSRSFVSFLIVFFYSTIALVSNILFPIGTHLSERFLFIPSLAFCLGGAYFIIHLLKRKNFNSWVLPLFVIVMSLYSIKTIGRNAVWKDDYTLFTTDVRTSKNSAKVRNAAAGAILDRAKTVNDEQEKASLIKEAIVHADRAIEIHPAYKSAHLLRGNAQYYTQNYEEAVRSFDQALAIDTYYDAAEENLFLALREGARYYGSKENNIDKSIAYLKRAVDIKPIDYECVSLLGIAYGNKGDHRKALEFFQKAVELEPNIARAYVNLGYAQLNMGEDEEAQISFQKAVRIDPKSLN